MNLSWGKKKGVSLLKSPTAGPQVQVINFQSCEHKALPGSEFDFLLLKSCCPNNSERFQTHVTDLSRPSSAKFKSKLRS